VVLNPIINPIIRKITKSEIGVFALLFGIAVWAKKLSKYH
jgi:hypothetical protein